MKYFIKEKKHKETAEERETRKNKIRDKNLEYFRSVFENIDLQSPDWILRGMEIFNSSSMAVLRRLRNFPDLDLKAFRKKSRGRYSKNKIA